MSNKYFKADVTDNISLNKRFKLLSLSPLSTVKIPEPGQFYMLQAGDTYDPLLKRPFSIFKIEQQSTPPLTPPLDKGGIGGGSNRAAEGVHRKSQTFWGREQQDIGVGTLSFLYRIRGKGTKSLSHLKSGDVINVIGPLGNSYPEPQGDFIAVAGGIGIASLLHLLKRFKNRAYLFYGARNKQELVMLNEAKSLSKESFVATDDGSEGKKGLITELLKSFLNLKSEISNFKLPIYACGPTPMLKELSRIIKNYSAIRSPQSTFTKCYVSLEEHMACGVGACLGCVIRVKGQGSRVKETELTYKRVCKEGPVFDIKDIVWE